MQRSSPTHATAAGLMLTGDPDTLQEQRGHLSDLELASALLTHAIQYLCDEQLAGRRSSPVANRLAIQILCDAAFQVARHERRQPGRRSLAALLRRALHHLRRYPA